jgi:hypothetical protein
MKLDLFFGLPTEFISPDAAAAHIAELKTRAEREAYWLRIPEGWRPMVGDFARLFIGHAISELPALAERRAALEEVPGIWREEVEWHIKRLYNTKDLRAMSDAEFATAYPEARARRPREGLRHPGDIPAGQPRREQVLGARAPCRRALGGALAVRAMHLPSSQ